jgi:class 3 adenylate cyclase
MLASMSQIDPYADTPLVDWSELGVSGLLPTGTVTLLLADVEGSTRLWETQPDEMTAAIARLNQTARDATAAAWEHGSVAPGFAVHLRPINAWAALAGGDLIAARRWADDAVATATGWALLAGALSARARVAIAQGESEQAERDAHDALASVPESFSYVGIPEILGCLGTLAVDAGSHREAARQNPSGTYGHGAVEGLGR